MSADPSSPPGGPEQPAPNGGEGNAADFIRQKRRHRPNEDKPVGTRDQQIAALTSLLANLMRDKAPAETPPPPREVYRFPKGKAAPAPAGASPPTASEAGTPAASASAATPPALPAAAPVVPTAPLAGERDYTRYSDEIVEQTVSQESAPASTAALPPGPIEVMPAAPWETSPVASAPGRAPGAAAAPVDPDTALASKDPSFWRPQQELPPIRKAPAWWYWVLTLLLAVAAFATGSRMPGLMGADQSDASQKPPAGLQPWSEAALERLEAILQADELGNLEDARKMGLALQTESGPLPGLDVYLNLLDARGLKLLDAQSRFLRLAAAGIYGPQLAAIENGLAFTFARQRRFSDASQALRRSISAYPFTAETFRLLGESLRREGLFAEAVTAFRGALLRYPADALEFLGNREYVKYKMRLAEIEGSLPVESHPPGGESEATGNAAGYWFLSDAAAALQQGKRDLAAAALQKAKAALPAPLFDRLLGDYFFRAYLDVPEVAAFFPSDRNAPKNGLRSQLVYFLDP